MSWKIAAVLRSVGVLPFSILRSPANLFGIIRGLGGVRRSLLLALTRFRQVGLRKLLAEAITFLRSANGSGRYRSDYRRVFAETLRPLAMEILSRESASASSALISIIMPTYKPNEAYLSRAVESVTRQTHKNWELVIVDDGSNLPWLRRTLEAFAGSDDRVKVLILESNLGIAGATNAGISLSRGEFIGFLDHDDLLEHHALEMMLRAFEHNPKAKVAYSDEDKVNPDGRYHSPHFKPAFDPVLLIGLNYISHFTVFRSDFLKSLGELDSKFNGLQDHEVLLRATARLRFGEVIHVPHVLYHWRSHTGSTALVPDEKGQLAYGQQAAALASLSDLGLKGTMTENLEMPYGVPSNLIRLSPKKTPKVSIVIPTKNQYQLLRQTVESIRLRTTYRNFELIVVDNGSDEDDALEFLCHLEESGLARLVRMPEPFNFSRLVNKGVEHASGELVCLMNNDIEITGGEWLEELTAWASIPWVGAVGARLWYPDGRLQHGGVILGVGGISKVAGHAHKYHQKGNPGYFGRAIHHQIFSAVTGACLVVSKEKYLAVGGFDEELKVAFNDVDFCLKLGRMGLQNIWSPIASMVHHESATRGIDQTPAQIRRAVGEVSIMRQRWGQLLDSDPSHHPLLAHDSESLSPRFGDYELGLLSSSPLARARDSNHKVASSAKKSWTSYL